MRYRARVSVVALVAVVAAAWLAQATLAGQTSASGARAAGAAARADQTSTAAAAAKAKPSTRYRTPWGDPDLQGIWTNATITPFERPAEFAGKGVLNDDEAAEFAKRTNERNTTDRPPPPGNPGGYNQFWFDRGTRTAGRQSALVIDPPDGKVPSFTPEAQKRSTERTAYQRAHPADSWEDVGLFTRCLTRGLPSAMTPGFYNHNYQFFQAPGYVAILVEMIHEARIIPLNSGSHLGPGVNLWMGDSRGRWDGDTLVVETTNFSPKAEYRGSSTKLRLVERFTRVDANTMNYEFTVEDSTTWTKPWTASIPMTKGDAPKYIYEYACHEGNYGIVNILAGHRAEENAKDQAAQKTR